MKRTYISSTIPLVIFAITQMMGSKATLAAGTTLFKGEKTIVIDQAQSFTVNLPAVAPGQQVRLSVDARLDEELARAINARAVGAMEVQINDKPPLSLSRLINKPQEFRYRGTLDDEWESGGLWLTVHAPDFTDNFLSVKAHYGLKPEDEPFHFVWDITDLVKAKSPNTITFRDKRFGLSSRAPLVVRAPSVEVGKPWKRIVAGEKVLPASTGSLATYLAQQSPAVDVSSMKVRLRSDGRIAFNVAGRAFEVLSRTSEPNYAWAPSTDASVAWKTVTNTSPQETTWTASQYTVTRTVSLQGDHIAVADKITATATPANGMVGVIYENRLQLPSPPVEKLIAGRPVFAGTNNSEDYMFAHLPLLAPAHPTAIARWDDLTVGMVAEDDIFRVHNKSFVEPGVIGLADPRLGIRPGESHTLEWSIYPRPGGDYWDFINAVRHNWGTNFRLEGPSSHDLESSIGPEDVRVVDGEAVFRTPERQHRWNLSRGQKFSTSDQAYYSLEEAKANISSFEGFDTEKVDKLGGAVFYWAQGTAIPTAKAWRDRTKNWIKNNHETPGGPVKSLIYVHPNIGTEVDSKTKYADAWVKNESGIHLTSPWPYYPLYMYLPTLANSEVPADVVDAPPMPNASPATNSYGKAFFDAIMSIVGDGPDGLGADGIFMDEFTWGGTPDFVYGLPWDGCTAKIDWETHAVLGDAGNQPSSSVLLQQAWRVNLIKKLREKNKLFVGNGPPYTRTVMKLQPQNMTELMANYSQIINMHLSSPWVLGNHHGLVAESDASMAQQARNCLDYGGLYNAYYWGYPYRDPKQPHFTSLMYPITPVQIRAGMVLGEERIITKESGRYGWPNASSIEAHLYNGEGQHVTDAETLKNAFKFVKEGSRTLVEVRMPSNHLAILIKQP